ncbi:MAG: helix-turn-helix domain-containing protein [Oscillospiraceae bacterium]|nr:helix-turn-helix domain-containing protein [Oscillospiraceae bacterium]
MLMTRSQAAEYLAISIRTLDRRTKAHQIPVIRPRRGGKVQYLRRDLDKYIEKFRQR